MTTPRITTSWVLDSSQKGPESLQYVEQHELPPVGEHDVLVNVHAALLNYCDLAILKVRLTFFAL